MVSTANLSSWTETLAILATYSGDKYQILCEQLAARLETEKFDIRSAVVCYVCAKNFSKTVGIWANINMGAGQGSQKLALQDLVEKMAVLQEATKFNQADALFNAKISQYAEILANSGRLTAAMRYLCLLRDDASSSMLRDRIYNSAPQQMSASFGRPPPFPFESTNVAIVYQPPAPAQPQYAPPGGVAQPKYGGAPGQPQYGGVPGYGQQNVSPAPNVGGFQPQQQPPMPQQQQRPPAPQIGGYGQQPGVGAPPAPGVYGGAPQQPAPVPASAPRPAAPAPGPMPRIGGAAPAPGPAPGMPGQMGGVPAPGAGAPYQQPAPQQQQAPMPGAYGQQPGFGQQQPMGGIQQPMGGMQQPGMYGGVQPPAQMQAAPAPAPAPAPPQGPNAHRPGGGDPRSTAPQSGAVPVIDGLPVAWPMPTKTQQKLSTTSTVAAANNEIQELSAGGGAGAVGEPMPAHDLQRVRNCLGMLLDQSAQDGNARKRDDIAKRLEELYFKLGSGGIKTQASQKVLQMVGAVEQQDFASATKIQMELATCDWDQNKNWLMGVKRLLPAR
eukprot:gnl/TRDRNA2_/TRDRNA2_94090_c2_seq1.p1 gnl/TRDRNA2_/TRDRNA2_94090_c2~~gnl/TRDRNA2_/TRDRNA2_94090_c2_seq1.p1  ORF type:complete len:635 (-),score=160.55 gnl/TRDRNA2_/TRDRNA2_94090_c2_seq1:69-1730(-)